MLNEWRIEVCKVRKGDRIFINDEWRTVTESRRYLGGPGEDGTYNNTPAWVINVAIPDTRWDYETYPTYGKQESNDYESPEPFWPYDCTEEVEFASWDDRVLMCSDEIETLDGKLQPIRWWVGVYEVDQGYGGPEEGGWWYEVGEVKQVAAASSYEEAQDIANKLREEWVDESRVPTYSVIYSGGNYAVRVKGSYPKDYPQRVPHYS